MDLDGVGFDEECVCILTKNERTTYEVIETNNTDKDDNEVSRFRHFQTTCRIGQ